MAVIKKLGTGVEILQSKYKNFIWKYPEHDILVQQVTKFLEDVSKLTECTPNTEGLSVQWQCIVGRVKQGRTHLIKTFEAKPPSFALHGKHAVTPHEIQTVFQGSVRLIPSLKQQTLQEINCRWT